MPQSTIELHTTLPLASPCRDGGLEPAPIEIGDQLKCMFDRLTTGPMPKRLLDLADALEEAFQRGELFDTAPPCKHSRAS